MFGRVKGVLFLCAMAALLAAAGCGGEDGASRTTSDGGRTAALELFLTDTSKSSQTGAWIQIFRVSLTAESSKQTLFENAVGETVNARSWSTEKGSQYWLASTSALPPGTYKSMEMVVSKEARLFGPDQTAEVKGDPSERSDQITLKLPLNPPLVLTAGSTNLVVDLDLGNWKMESGALTPALKLHTGEGIEDLDRQTPSEKTGVVTGLTGEGENRLFDLSLPGGARMKVKTTGETLLASSTGGAFELSDAQVVEVRGVYDTLGRAVIASELTLQSGASETATSSLRGAATEANATEGTFKATNPTLRGFLPKNVPLLTKTSETTTYLLAKGEAGTKEDFFKALANPDSQARAEGRFNPDTNTFEASLVRIVAKPVALEQEITGEVVSVNPVDGSIKIKSSDKEVILILEDTSAIKRGEETATKAALLENLKPGESLTVKGIQEKAGFRVRKALAPAAAPAAPAAPAPQVKSAPKP